MSTYLLVTTVDADDPHDAIAIARGMDEPTDVPTVEELRESILDQLGALADAAVSARSHDAIDAELHLRANRILEIVTLGSVLA